MQHLQAVLISLATLWLHTQLGSGERIGANFLSGSLLSQGPGAESLGSAASGSGCGDWSYR